MYFGFGSYRVNFYDSFWGLGFRASGLEVSGVLGRFSFYRVRFGGVSEEVVAFGAFCV